MAAATAGAAVLAAAFLAVVALAAVAVVVFLAAVLLAAATRLRATPALCAALTVRSTPSSWSTVVRARMTLLALAIGMSASSKACRTSSAAMCPCALPRSMSATRWADSAISAGSGREVLADTKTLSLLDGNHPLPT